MPLVRSEKTLTQFFMFACVGVAGFVVDSTVLVVLLNTHIAGPYLSRLASFLCAVTFTWAANRWLTFPATGASRSVAGQWAHFVSINAVGGALNLLVYALLVATLELVGRHPVLGVAAGSIAGLLANFTLSRLLVFRAHSVRSDPTRTT